ncbi:4Fe-4S binding protein [Thermodesulfobacteriota bacterium]
MSDQDYYAELSTSIGAGDSPLIPRLFKFICDDEEAKLLLAASPPKTAEELAQELSFSTEKVEKMLVTLFAKGLIFKSKKPGEVRYYRVRNIMQFHDATILWKDAPKEFFELWKEHTDKEIPDFWRLVKKAVGRQPARVIPIGSTIEPKNQVLAFEDIPAIVEKARTIAVTKCTCRVVTEAPCDKPVEVCFQLDKAADYAIDRGSGRAVTKEEALRMMKEAEEAGLVHTTENHAGVFHTICNCCSDCCINWYNAEAKGLQVTAPSRFLAEVDTGTCTACGTCIEECPFDAIAFSENEEYAEINAEECMGCGVCAVLCPDEAISLNEIRKPEFVPAA